MYKKGARDVSFGWETIRLPNFIDFSSIIKNIICLIIKDD